MTGRLLISESGELSGWVVPPARGRESWVDIRVDGVHAASVLALPECGLDGGLAFSFQLRRADLEGHVHRVQAHLRGGGELAGSPAPFEARRDSAPASAFLLRPPEEGVAAPAEPGFVAADGRIAVRYEAKGVGDCIEVPQGTLVQNRPDIGGKPEHRAYRPWPAYVAAFRDYYVDPRYGGVYRPEGGAVWQGATYLFNTLAEHQTCMQVLSGALAAAPAERCILFCNSVRGIYFHWHLDCLAGLLAVRERVGPGPVAIGPRLNGWQRASLALLGEEVVEMHAACRVEQVYLASHLDGRGIHPDAGVLRLYERLKAAHLGRRREAGRGGGGHGHRLFISRRDARHRVLANEDELWAALRPRGFVRFVPGEADYGEQVEAFAAAEVIVASHGSALTNMGFCAPGTQVVEILPEDYVNGCFRYLAIACRLRHAWYTSELTAPFAVDVPGFMDWCAAERLF